MCINCRATNICSMFLIRTEVRVSLTISVSSSMTMTASSANVAKLDVKDRREEMEPMDCEMCDNFEMTDNAWFNNENNEPFGHSMDEMNCSDKRCGPGTSENIRTEAVTPMEVDS